MSEYTKKCFSHLTQFSIRRAVSLQTKSGICAQTVRNRPQTKLGTQNNSNSSNSNNNDAIDLAWLLINQQPCSAVTVSLCHQVCSCARIEGCNTVVRDCLNVDRWRRICSVDKGRTGRVKRSSSPKQPRATSLSSYRIL